MRNVWITAWREFKATAMTKAFVFGVIVLPVLFYAVLGGAAAAGIFDEKEETLRGAVAVHDTSSSDRITDALREQLTPETLERDAQRRGEEAQAAMEQAIGPLAEDAMAQAQSGPAQALLSAPEADVEIEALDDDADLEAAKQRVIDGELLALISVTGKTLEPPLRRSDGATQEEIEQAKDNNRYELFVAENLRANFRDMLRDATNDAIVGVRFEEAGLDKDRVDRLRRRPQSTTKSVSESGETESNDILLRLIPMAFVILLFIAVFTGAQYLMMSTIEEKSSRVMEVLLSAVSPMQLMTGKIIGQGLVGLCVMVLYGGLGIAALVTFSLSLDGIGVGVFIWQGVYFLMAYVSIAAIMAAIGAAVTEIKEAQALQGPVIGGLVLVFYFSIFLGMQNPHAIVAQVLSFIPPFTPLVMSMRVAQVGDPVPMWQLISTGIIGVAGAVFLVWAAAKIFRVGVLMYGTPPTLGGLIKWLRYA